MHFFKQELPVAFAPVFFERRKVHGEASANVLVWESEKKQSCENLQKFCLKSHFDNQVYLFDPMQ